MSLHFIYTRILSDEEILLWRWWWWCKRNCVLFGELRFSNRHGSFLVVAILKIWLKYKPQWTKFTNNEGKVIFLIMKRKRNIASYFYQFGFYVFIYLSSIMNLRLVIFMCEVWACRHLIFRKSSTIYIEFFMY